MLEPNDDSVEVGRGLRLTATVTNAAGNPISVPVTWSASDSSVAGIHEEGSGYLGFGPPPTMRTAIIWGEGVGIATVTARANGHAASASIRVFGERAAFTTVSAGHSLACGTTAAASAYCWGVIPIRVSYAIDFTSLSPASGFTCGLSTNGKAYCWGSNFYGRLGTGDLDDRSSPTPVTGDLVFVVVESGTNHACGLTPDGLAYCWGENGLGELGNEAGSSCDLFGNVAPCSPSPTLVSGGLRFVSLSVGGSHACGLTAEGTAYCWGYDGHGQLGASTGETCGHLGSTYPCSRTPVAVSGGLTFADVSAGGPHTCAVTTDGDAYCWGWNVTGQLGTGDTVSYAVPAAVAGGITFAAIRASTRAVYDRVHSCGIGVDGVAYCWGNGSSGQLGDGTRLTSLVPVAVSGPQFASVSVGGEFTCGIAASGGAYCWGEPAWSGPVASTTPERVFGQP